MEKPAGFIHGEEYKSLAKWMKLLFHNACAEDPIVFGNLLSKLQHKPKDTVCKLARRKNMPIESLTLEQLNIMLE